MRAMYILALSIGDIIHKEGEVWNHNTIIHESVIMIINEYISEQLEPRHFDHIFCI